MFQRRSGRNPQQRRTHRDNFEPNEVSFSDPVAMNSATFSLSDLNNQYSRLQQLLGQQSTSSSSASSSSSPPDNLSSLSSSNLLPQHLQLLFSQQQQLIAQQNPLNAQQHQILTQHHQHHHHRHRSRHQSSSSRHHRLQQQQLLKEKEAKLKEKEDGEHKRKLTAMDLDLLRVKNKASYTINWSEWQQRMESVDIEPKDTNRLIMDYLICEGDYDIAMSFSKESHTKHDMLNHKHFVEKCRARAEIKHCINNGEMLKSMDLLNKYHPAFLMKHADILLDLEKQHLIELIHCSKINEAFSYNLKYLVPKTKLHYNGNSLQQREKNKQLLVEIGDILTLIACRNLKYIPVKQRELLSLDKRHKLSDKINRILLKNDKKQRILGHGESLLFENMAKMNYYQDLLMNLGIKHHFERGKISPHSKIMSYNEENIRKVKLRYPEFGKNNKHRGSNEAINGIQNWVKLDNKHRLKVRNYLPFAFDTSKCHQFQVKPLKKCNIIHVCEKQ